MEIGDRIEILQQEYQQCGQRFQALQQEQAQLRMQMLRIEGAISVLNDMQQGSSDAPSEPDRSEPSEPAAT